MIVSHNRVAKWSAAALRRSLQRLITNRDDGIRGVAAIEFAVMAASLVLMMVCVVDIGMGFYRKMQVQNAAQAGAQYALLYGFEASSIANAVTGATSFSGISASPAPTKYCGCASTSGITSLSCSSTCADGSTPATYVSVSAQGTYDTILPYPLIPNSFALTEKSVVRVQ
jgi:Flp pilus assembly protein TadG